MNKQREKVKTYNIYSAYDKRYIREAKKGKRMNIIILKTMARLGHWQRRNWKNESNND